MNYYVSLSYGADGTAGPTITDVKEVVITDDTYVFYGDDGEILFAAPKEKVVYIKKN